MSWLWEKSSLWRRIVATTKQSRVAMASFTVVACAIPYYAGKVILQVNRCVDTWGSRLSEARARSIKRLLSRSSCCCNN